ARLDIMASGQNVGAKVAGDGHQVDEFYRLVAGNAGNGGFALLIGIGEGLDDRGFEALFIVEHVVRNAQLGGDAAGVVNVLTSAAGPLAMGGLAMIVELEGDAHDLIAL